MQQSNITPTICIYNAASSFGTHVKDGYMCWAMCQWSATLYGPQRTFHTSVSITI